MKINFLGLKTLFIIFIEASKLEKIRKKSNEMIEKGLIIEARDYLNDNLNVVCKRIMKKIGINVEVEGIENIDKEKSYLIVSNHQSLMDILLLWGYLGSFVGFVAKKELITMPFIGKWLQGKFFNLMDRDDPKQAIKIINNSAELIKLGINQCIFPEGTRTVDGNVGEFKAGSFKIATKAKTEILPVMICGSDELLPKGGLNIYKKNIMIKILKPVDTKEFGNSTSFYAKSIQELISKELYDYRERTELSK